MTADRKKSVGSRAPVIKPSNGAEAWFASQGWKSLPFQREVWKHLAQGKSGLLNAPTGTGKTYAVWGGVVNRALKEKKATRGTGLRAIWITPLRALANEIADSAQRMCIGTGLPWTVGTRTGDTSTKERAEQKKKLPQLLVTTPESLHVLLAQKNSSALFKDLDWFIADEWHELLGSKRGVQVELALSRLKGLRPSLSIWGISATIGNLEEAKDVLLGQAIPSEEGASSEDPSQGSVNGVLVRAALRKKIEMHTIIPDHVEKYPWAGHLGLKLAKQLLPIIAASTSTLIFTNTRSQAETWYHHLLEIEPDLAGTIALHHGSLDRKLREWVEHALDEGRLKAVVCTSSLDLGVDFRPVATVVQVGGPKGVARFIQRAGRSGHQPDAVPLIWFLPTHALELVEAAALRAAIADPNVEPRQPMIRCFDVLAQYLVTLAVGDGFVPKQILEEVRSTFCFQSMSDDEWAWMMTFITTGGKSLLAYDEFRKCIIGADGIVRVEDRRMALRHRMSIGTIVSGASLSVKYMSGGFIGTIEESFLNQLRRGDVFWFAGRPLEFLQVKGLTAYVARSKATKGRIPSWQGARMPLSSQMASILRNQFAHALPDPGSRSKAGIAPELVAVRPLIERQLRDSIVPADDELLIERFKSRAGHHVVIYPFEGRVVHEALAALLAFRMSLLRPITFTMAMNDLGFELLSDQPIPIEEALDNDLFSDAHLLDDLQRSLNATEMAKRRFRDIAKIAGLVFEGFPGRHMKERHVRGNSSLFFEVFSEHEPDHLLLRQAYDEAFNLQLDLPRLHAVLQRIANQRIIVKDPGRFTPFAFPIVVDRLSGMNLTSEQVEDRIRKMTENLEKA